MGEEQVQIGQEEKKLITQVDGKLKKLVEYVLGKAQSQPIHEVERGILASLISLGLMLLKLFLMSKGTGHVGLALQGKDGVGVPYHSTKRTTYFSIFGRIEIRRAYCWEEGLVSGFFPLDAMLNLPERCFSYLLQE
jgi:hypothetical protein